MHTFFSLRRNTDFLQSTTNVIGKIRRKLYKIRWKMNLQERTVKSCTLAKLESRWRRFYLVSGPKRSANLQYTGWPKKVSHYQMIEKSH